MTTPELILALRTTKSRSKRTLLDKAADTIETLSAQLDTARAERDAVTLRTVELKQIQRWNAFAHTLRATMNCNDQRLLDVAADTIEELAARLFATQDVRDAVTQRMIELERILEEQELAEKEAKNEDRTDRR